MVAILKALVIATAYILLGLISILLSIKLIFSLTCNLDDEAEIKAGNIALSIYIATILFCGGYVLKDLLPLMHLLVFSPDTKLIKAIILIFILLIGVIFFVILTVISAVWIIDKSTAGIEEWKEIEKNNVASAIVISGAIFTLTLFIRQAVLEIFQLFIPSLQ